MKILCHRNTIYLKRLIVTERKIHHKQNNLINAILILPQNNTSVLSTGATPQGEMDCPVRAVPDIGQ